MLQLLIMLVLEMNGNRQNSTHPPSAILLVEPKKIMCPLHFVTNLLFFLEETG
jgi:hypothetical protein